MYGTIARIRPRAGQLGAIERLMAEWEAEMRPRTPGSHDGYLFVPDAGDGTTAHLVAVFDDEASYRASAASPEQDAWYRRLRALLEADPDWMDGEFRR